MTNLISGKEALIALANGEKVQWCSKDFPVWDDLDTWNANTRNFLHDTCIEEGGFNYRLKPRTINLNGIEIPAPFEPKEEDVVFVLDNSDQLGFSTFTYNSGFYHVNFGAWRSEEEIKQVVAALRQVFGASQ
ncbi:hypothetical protein ABFP25_02050 [Acinetobacter indicus]|uniref:hypothetical protein n=1 Tax=Acinetobacter indicus TaxID=756892 RepID=UPI003214D119